MNKAKHRWEEKLIVFYQKIKMRKKLGNAGILQIGVKYIFETQKIGEKRYGSTTQPYDQA